MQDNHSHLAYHHGSRGSGNGLAYDSRVAAGWFHRVPPGNRRAEGGSDRRTIVLQLSPAETAAGEVGCRGILLGSSAIRGPWIACASSLIEGGYHCQLAGRSANRGDSASQFPRIRVPRQPITPPGARTHTRSSTLGTCAAAAQKRARIAPRGQE